MSFSYMLHEKTNKGKNRLSDKCKSAYHTSNQQTHYLLYQQICICVTIANNCFLHKMGNDKKKSICYIKCQQMQNDHYKFKAYSSFHTSFSDVVFFALHFLNVLFLFQSLAAYFAFPLLDNACILWHTTTIEPKLLHV